MRGGNVETGEIGKAKKDLQEKGGDNARRG